MASIFTFDPDPPRVRSPWSTPPPGSRSRIPQDSISDGWRISADRTRRGTMAPSTLVVDQSAMTRLEAEPQEGPTEYKLHLLLRRRRSFVRTSTGRHISGSFRRIETPPLSSAISRSASESGLLSNTPPPLAAIQSRQHRLEQLTTQLLWRLQQSCPNHISSSTALVLPHLPDEVQLSAPAVPQRLLPGLEESRGALYEIGVADDGTFVGLAEDEMEESLNNLRAMAASLGCRVDVQLMVQVGDCEWIDDAAPISTSQPQLKTDKLWVAEALVRPDQHILDRRDETPPKHGAGDLRCPAEDPLDQTSNETERTTDQVRVSLTGATMSGKSSLLGSLSTATLDNGRGKSRLSLLKHRHEIASGMTSSVTQELIGYRDIIDQDSTRISTQVISYGAGDVSSWVDIHASAEGGRLVLISDSAGHPRYRRTTVRGLVGWAPHWTLVCIPADNTDDSSGKIGASPTSQEILGLAATDVDLSQTHLQLCLNLELPLVVVITKYDLATKAGLKQVLSKVLSAIKEAGRTPRILRIAAEGTSEAELNNIPNGELLEVGAVAQALETDPLSTVLIVLTSAVNGIAITKLHSLLRQLPLPIGQPKPPDPSRTLFYVEDTYSNIVAPTKDPSLVSPPSHGSLVIGGHLQYGTLHIGDELLLGPYPVDAVSDDSDSGSGRDRRSTPPNRSTRNSPLPTSRSFPGALRKGQSDLRATLPERQAEWRRVRITSLRNLRLPVRSLHAGQVGTIGVAALDLPIASPAVVRIRKGMVLTDGVHEAQSNRVIKVRFAGDNARSVQCLTVGSGVVLYIASVRASAKVVSVGKETVGSTKEGMSSKAEHDEEEGFGFGFDEEEAVQYMAGVDGLNSPTVVTFQFIASREFVESDAKVLVLPGGGPGLYGGTERGEKGVAALEGGSYIGFLTLYDMMILLRNPKQKAGTVARRMGCAMNDSSEVVYNPLKGCTMRFRTASDTALRRLHGGDMNPNEVRTSQSFHNSIQYTVYSMTSSSPPNQALKQRIPPLPHAIQLQLQPPHFPPRGLPHALNCFCGTCIRAATRTRTHTHTRTRTALPSRACTRTRTLQHRKPILMLPDLSAQVLGLPDLLRRLAVQGRGRGRRERGIRFQVRQLGAQKRVLGFEGLRGGGVLDERVREGFRRAGGRAEEHRCGGEGVEGGGAGGREVVFLGLSTLLTGLGGREKVGGSEVIHCFCSSLWLQPRVFLFVDCGAEVGSVLTPDSQPYEGALKEWHDFIEAPQLAFTPLRLFTFTRHWLPLSLPMYSCASSVRPGEAVLNISTRRIREPHHRSTASS
ncbi:hypothetical protein K491DRAFT_674624 [Lophiostoma macrostomum CBS 122681]|uniref:Tr-type G domain-containing protein n=1 Tax=Lophiostoma macrostomum CBS 122681 TaxID=1314788 RepID=A0A6A6TP68_9PLEO|nr:hypothetical protein K491DRAFT_674624 [Lophiostoma macrostomum CBS 122681]